MKSIILIDISLSCPIPSYLYLCSGDLHLLPALHKLIEPTRLSSSELLHVTSIRNENAYYRCIIAVLSERGVIIDNSPQYCEGTIDGIQSTQPRISNDPKRTSQSSNTSSKKQDTKNVSKVSELNTVTLCDDYRSTKLSLNPQIILEASQRPIYICGDSHCLSPAWSVIYQECDKKVEASVTEGVTGVKIKVPRLLVPRLVTGIKQWHLRPQGVFYPKTGFQHTIEKTPSGADVS